MNKVILIGRLTNDPELRYTTNGTPVCNFTIAVNGERQDETLFVKIIAWAKQAESCSEYLSKGRLVAVDGKLQIRSYEDREGNKRKTAEVVARQVKFLGGQKGKDLNEDAPF